MLVGRDAELDQARQLVDGAGPVVITGPPGIGKTSLARAALGTGPFREAGALSSLAWAPLLVFARLLRRQPSEDPAEVAASVLRTGTTPVLIDDLQWADDASLEVLGHLRGRVPLVATVRTGEARTDHVIGAMQLLGARTLELGGLPSDAARRLARHLHPDLTDQERTQLLDVAQGNPLLLAELPGAVDGPTTLVSALLHRVDALGPEGRQALVRLAVLGRPAGPEVLGPGAADLTGTGLVVESEGGLAVRHPLLSEVIVEGLGSEVDDVRHRLAAEVGDGEAAHLLLAAGDRAAARARALHAAEQGDRRTRAELLALAVACAPDLDADNRLRAARLFTATGQPARARELCAAEGVADLPPFERGSLRAAEGEAAWLQGRSQDSADLVARALPDLEGTGTASEVLVLAGSTVFQTFVELDGRPALAQARRAVQLADEIGEEQGYARSRLASVLLTAGEDGWAELYGEVIDRAGREGDRELQAMAVTSLVLGHWVQGDTSRAEEIARREVAEGPDGDLDHRWLAVAAYAALLGLQAGRDRGELVEEFAPLLAQEPLFQSRPYMEAAVALARADAGDHGGAAAVAPSHGRELSDPLAHAIALWVEVERAWLAGRPDEALARVDEVLGLGVGDHPAAVQARLVGAHAAWEVGHPPMGPPPAPTLPAWRPAEGEWEAVVAAIAGDHERAAAGFAEASDAWSGADLRSALRCAWAAGHAAATGGLPDGVDRLLDAETRAAAAGFRALEARTRRSLRTVGAGRRVATVPGLGGLTGREVEVLDLVAAGLTSGQVAAALGIGEATVNDFVASAVRRLGATSRVAAVARLQELRQRVHGEIRRP